MTKERQIELTALAQRVCELVPSEWGWWVEPFDPNRMPGVIREPSAVWALGLADDRGPHGTTLQLIRDLAKRTRCWVGLSPDDVIEVGECGLPFGKGETLAENVCLAYVHYLGGDAWTEVAE